MHKTKGMVKRCKYLEHDPMAAIILNLVNIDHRDNRKQKKG